MFQWFVSVSPALAPGRQFTMFANVVSHYIGEHMQSGENFEMWKVGTRVRVTLPPLMSQLALFSSCLGQSVGVANANLAVVTITSTGAWRATGFTRVHCKAFHLHWVTNSLHLLQVPLLLKGGWGIVKQTLQKVQIKTLYCNTS